MRIIDILSDIFITAVLMGVVGIITVIMLGVVDDIVDWIKDWFR